MKAIERIVRDVPGHWVGDGFPVRSLFAYSQDAAGYDPFLLLDYAGPHEFAPGTAPRGVGEHPHRGFETVTIIYQGEVAHRDSSGGGGLIGPGDVQWMTAASGLVHQEFHGERFTREGGVLEMAQLWVNLPAKDKMSPPAYQDIPSARIPAVPLEGGGSARVIAGEFRGTRGPARTFTPIDVLDLTLPAGGRVALERPEGHTTLLVVRRGTVRINGAETLDAVGLARLSRHGREAVLEAAAGASVLLLGGEPIGEPVVGQGPFVMNTTDEIRQAMIDYRSGRMGRLSG